MWKGISASLSFTVTVIGLPALATTPVAAAESLEMLSYLDAPGGPEIAAGDYDAAIASASSRPWRRTTEWALIASTNLCVAYTVKGELEAAEAACDEALVLAGRVDRSARLSGRRLIRDDATARALTNRGVVRAAIGDALLAASDFREAERMSGAWEVPGRNLELLESSALYLPALAAAE